MRRAGLLALAASLAACSLGPTGAAGGARPRSGAQRSVVSTKASPSPSSQVLAAASTSPTPAPTPWPALKAPSGPSDELAGVLLLSREALAAFGQGAPDGGGAWRLPVGNPTLATNPVPPPTLVGADGRPRAAVKALLSGTAEAELARTGLLSNNGGNLISDHGGGLISDAGGGLISDAGGGLISNNGGAWRLLQAEAPASGPATWPVAGLAVAALDLRTGQALPVGEMPDGSPAYEVLTDAQGRYQLHLPPKSRGHALLVSALRPNLPDPKGSLGALAQLGQKDQGLNPSSAQLYRFIRRMAASRLARMLAAQDEAALTDYVGRMFDGMAGGNFLKPTYTPLFLKLHRAGKEGGVPALGPEAREALALRIADQGMNGLDFDALRVDPETNPFWFGAPVNLGPALMDSLARLHRAFDAHRLANPGPPTSGQLPGRVVVDESGERRSWQASAAAQGLLKADFPLNSTYDLDLVLTHGVIRNADPAHNGTVIYTGVLNFFGAKDHDPEDAVAYEEKFGAPMNNGARFSILALQALVVIFQNLLNDPDPDGDGLGVQAAALAIARQGAAGLPQAESPASAP